MTRRPLALLAVTLGAVLAATPAFAGPHGGGGGGGGGGRGGHGGGGYGGGGYRGGGYRGHGGYGHYGHGGYGHYGPRVFVGGSFFVDPFFWPTYPYYYAPYPSYGYPVAPPPDDGDWAGEPPTSDDSDARDDTDTRNAPPPDQRARQETPEEADRANYGLIQLRGVPDGAAIDLDGRFWLKAMNLEKRWLAVPHGEHRVTVYVANTEPVERRVDVSPGKNQVVKFGPFPRNDS